MKKLSQQSYPNLRMRRLRNNKNLRSMLSETKLYSENLIQPIFVIEGKQKKQRINSLPGINRLSIDNVIKEVRKLKNNGIKAAALFPSISNKNKSSDAAESYNSNGLIQTCVKKIKDIFPEFIVITDVALDPYTSHGQDGIMNKSGNILNDETNDILVKQALSHANSGADILAPSDMMDGRIRAIRKELEKNNYHDTKILAYAAKYASNYYGPFREAVGSLKSLGKSDKKTYQMDFRNRNEALREVDLDLREGADLVMVKPAMPYLDVIMNIKTNFKVPVFAYHVSGEYLMIKSATKTKILNEKQIVLESLSCIRRAGATCILTYYALEVAKWLK